MLTALPNSHRLARSRVATHNNSSGAGSAAVAEAAPEQQVVPLYSGQRAVVVGAGPAGSTAAMFLARQGFSVDVFERRPEPKQDAVDTGRAYIIILIPRGQAALKELGVPLPSQREFITKGTVRHDRKGKVGISREEGNVTFSRSSLAQYLIDQARQRYPSQITFHFDSACADLRTAADYEALLRKKFVGVPDDWVPAIAQQAAAATPSPAGKRVRCSRLDGPGVLLLGDAAHAVTPVFGQGANSALESCKVLGSVLAEAGGDASRVPQLFTSARLADMHALNELDAKAYSFFRRRGLLDPDFLQLLSHVLLGTILSKLVPFLYGPKPALLKLGSTTPYSTIIAAVKRDSLMAAVGFAALGVWLSFKLAAKVMVGA